MSEFEKYLITDGRNSIEGIIGEIKLKKKVVDILKETSLNLSASINETNGKKDIVGLILSPIPSKNGGPKSWE